MPSSLIIVALAAAWLVVLVPMVARKRQQIARTADNALAGRVVRSGRTERRKESSMSDNDARGVSTYADEDVLDEPDAPDEFEDLDEGPDGPERDDFADEPPEEYAQPERVAAESGGRRYRPGRGGFDPEAAEIAARAKYAYRQRVVLGLLIAAVLTALAAGFVWSQLWWVNAVVVIALVGYLVYLRRQVRIENEIRQRRMERIGSARAGGSRQPRPGPGAPEPDAFDDEADHGSEELEELEEPAEAPIQRLPLPEHNPVQRVPTPPEAVVVDLDDEDPAFHELDDPEQVPFRRAVGE